MITTGFDAIHANVSALPKGAQAAGYTTGTPDIRWTGADWAAHPGAVRICQDAGASDRTADLLDVERYAATIADAGPWARDAQAEWLAGTRPGQRWPAVYVSAASVTPLVNGLISENVKSGVGLVVAHWGLTEGQAAADVEAAAGPFPIVGMQYASGPQFDFDVFDQVWLARVSAAGPPYLHETDGKSSLGQLAGSRGYAVADVFDWLALQQRLHPVDAENLAAAAVPPAGMHWYTVNK